MSLRTWVKAKPVGMEEQILTRAVKSEAEEGNE
jgi:hypothetical protein